jgi:hypothetical protein
MPTIGNEAGTPRQLPIAFLIELRIAQRDTENSNPQGAQTHDFKSIELVFSEFPQYIEGLHRFFTSRFAFSPYLRLC